MALTAGAGAHVGNAGLHADAVTGLEVVNFAAGFDNHTGSLVTEHHGSVHDEGSNAAVLVIVHIAAADADAADADANIPGTHFKWQCNIAQREAEFLFQNQGFHDTSIINSGADLCGQRPSGALRTWTPAGQPV